MLGLVVKCYFNACTEPQVKDSVHVVTRRIERKLQLTGNGSRTIAIVILGI